MSLRRWLLLGVATVVAALPAAPALAGGGRPSLRCGQTVTTSLTLTRDLVGCPGDGLVVGADGITIDLGGHAIRGVNTVGGTGVVVDGHRGVRVVNGTISDFFAAGVSLHASPDALVRDLRVRRIGAGGVEPQTSAGIHVDGSPGVRVLDSVVRNEVDAFQSDGVVVLGSPGAVLRGNRLVRNAWNGAVVIESPDARVTGNELDGNGNNGLEVNGASDRALVALNHAAGNAQFGLVVGASSDVRVVGNDVSGNPEAGILSFDLIDGLLAGNGATGNGVGILLAGGQNGSHGNRVLANRAVRNHDVGILLDGAADDNEVRGNEASGNGGGDGFGIIVFESTGNVLADNVANANAADGIRIEEEEPGASAGNTLTRNVANRNGGHGINAVAGTIDGGGNRGRNNATPPDCIGVACS
jgi:parallel beta-helix repeat protein